MQKKLDWPFICVILIHFLKFFLLDRPKHFVLVVVVHKKDEKHLLNSDKYRLNSFCAVFAVITHEIPNVFQNYILCPFFSYFCTHDIQYDSQSAKNCN